MNSTLEEMESRHLSADFPLKKIRLKKSKGALSIRGATQGVSFFSGEKHYSTFPRALCRSDDTEFRRSRCG